MTVVIAKLRRIGNSLGIILPKESLDALHKSEGDEVQVTIHAASGEQARRFDAAIGSVPGLGRQPFRRERRDRF